MRIALRDYHARGKLNATQQLLFRKVRPPEELYDLQSDPHEINNLASDPAFAGKLREMRGRLDDWMVRTNDHGRQPESAKMFDSDMAVYTNKFRSAKGNPAHLKIIEDNLALMKKWASEGK